MAGRTLDFAAQRLCHQQNHRWQKDIRILLAGGGYVHGSGFPVRNDALGRIRKMKIKILGTGCPKCKKLYAEAEKAIAASGVKVDLEKVENIVEIIQYGVMATPGLVINEEVKASGRIPQSNEIVSWIAAAAKSAG
jgi:small redox-active disulfide protein 2